MNNRLQKLRAMMLEREFDALLVSKAENIYYLSAFTGSSAALIITQEEAILISDFRYRLQAAVEATEWLFVEAASPLMLASSSELQKLATKRICCEAAVISYQEYSQLTGCLLSEQQLYPEIGLIEELRLIKEAGELEAIRRAAYVTDEACAHAMSLVRPGVTEKELALAAEWRMRELGAEKVAFDIIIAAGERGALPHAQPGERVLTPGDLLVMDMGAMVNHYCADMTRTFAVAYADEQAQEIYRVCARAQQQGVDKIHAGMTGREADALVRDIITEAGYADYFGHGTGHGVGLEIHESPRASVSYAEVIPAGATLTIEPGIYLPGFGGVRIEDLVVVHENGTEVITGAAKPLELSILG